MKNNISTICENSLCTGCGACGGVCPAKCILLKRNTAGFLRAYIDKKQCLECGRCVKVCPQIRMMDIDKSRREVKGFIAYAKNLQVRKRGQSGGVVTALLSFLLKKGEIDGAVINKFNRDRHINEAVYVDDNEMLLEGAGSYYSQSDVCKTIYENKSRKVAAVLLGCQSRSVKMAENAGELKNVKYKIGLICAGQYSSLMMKDIVKKSKVTLPEVIKFRWRDKQISG